MSRNDLHVIVRHMLVALATIALLVAAPILWGALTQQPDAAGPQQRVVQAQGGGLPTP